MDRTTSTKANDDNIATAKMKIKNPSAAALLLSSHLSATLTLYAAHHAHAYFAHLIIVV
jgi:hypothetical protein